MVGCKTVIHCGLGNARAIVRGTRNLLELASNADITRFVHMSTAAVYGITPAPGCETEDAPLRRTGDAYADNKGKAEVVVRKFCRRGLPTVILRPSIVYGPYSAWSTRLIEDLRADRVALINGGRGACNTTYVDNLVDAIFLSVENERAIGEAFFITDGEQITWGDFIKAHVEMLSLKGELPDFSEQELCKLYRTRSGLFMGSLKASARALRSKELRQLLLQIPVTQRLLTHLWGWLESLPEQKRERIRLRVGVPRKSVAGMNKSRFLPDEVTMATQSTTIFFRIDKARAILGYSPRVSFTKGINLVEHWLRFANYL
jgi:nucleoside-diphosphate-sugar epimerase